MSAIPKELQPRTTDRAMSEQESIAVLDKAAKNKAGMNWKASQYPNDLAKGGGGGKKNYRPALTPGTTPAGS